MILPDNPYRISGDIPEEERTRHQKALDDEWYKQMSDIVHKMLWGDPDEPSRQPYGKSITELPSPGPEYNATTILYAPSPKLSLFSSRTHWRVSTRGHTISRFFLCHLRAI